MPTQVHAHMRGGRHCSSSLACKVFQGEALLAEICNVQMEVNIAEFADIVGADGTKYREAADLRREAMNELMWDEASGIGES